MKKVAIIDEKTHEVKNVSILGNGKWSPPMGHYIVDVENVVIGDKYDPEKKHFVRTFENNISIHR